MSRHNTVHRVYSWLAGLTVALGCCPIALAVQHVAAAAAAPTTLGVPATQRSRTGPDVVMLNELENLYQPVPFDHRRHAEMSQTSLGCAVCHHRSPDTTAQPACKSCHPQTRTDLVQPGLKGAYHRQCLNCHRDWAHANDCVVCHRPREGVATTSPIEPTPDDIVGRMHPPIHQPTERHYTARFTPADGGNVLFRHNEHVSRFGLHCADCHYRDTCGDCHDSQARTIVHKPLAPGNSWAESHGPCMSCHQQARCNHCHYKDGQSPPKAFDHQTTGQLLDGSHADLGCASCHRQYAFSEPPTCGDSACHGATERSYPQQRPGPLVREAHEASAASAGK